MKNQLIISCVLLAVLASYASALECYECKDKEDDSACGKMGEEWDGDHDTIKLVECREPGINETGRAVCGKTITTFQSNQNPDNNGIIASRYCDIVDFKDQCWEKYGGVTTSVICVCADKDGCNSAVTSVVSMVTLVAAVIAAML